MILAQLSDSTLSAWETIREGPYYPAGVFTGRILKGEKAGELPIQQDTKVELLLDLSTAKALGITARAPTR